MELYFVKGCSRGRGLRVFVIFREGEGVGRFLDLYGSRGKFRGF